MSLWKRTLWLRRYLAALAFMVFIIIQTISEYPKFVAGAMTVVVFFGGHALFIWFYLSVTKKEVNK